MPKSLKNPLLKEVQAWLDSAAPEQDVPQMWEEDKPLTAVGKAVNGLLVIQALRPDCLTAMARIFVEKVLGSAFAHAADKELNLVEIVESEVLLRVSPRLTK